MDIQVDGQPCVLEILDTAGTQQFVSMRDLNQQSFHDIRTMRDQIIIRICAVVGPVDLHHVAFPRRRIFVFQLGYFEFEQIADQKPDLGPYARLAV
ncbi:hypothetical protein niasHS_016589 [Heterodera schachtii]|uniref:Uncharacterized protein n=1 Tax=Heterodera schachtii TaxID=97005 RepID=A0ABD2HRL1_HETSC